MAKNSEAFVVKYKESYNASLSRLQSIVDALTDVYEVTQNTEAKKYADELEKYIEEVKDTVKNNKVFTFEEEKVFIEYIDELISKYMDCYQTLLARESLKRYASQGIDEYDEMPLWENVTTNGLNEYDDTDQFDLNYDESSSKSKAKVGEDPGLYDYYKEPKKEYDAYPYLKEENKEQEK